MHVTKRCWSGSNSQPWVDLETRLTRLACFLFCKVKVILDLWCKGKSHKWHVCTWGSSDRGVVQEVPTHFVHQGTELSFILISLWHDVTTIQPRLVLPWIKELPCLLLQVNFWCGPSLFLPRKSLLTVRGNLRKKRVKEEAGRRVALFCYLASGPTAT